MINQVDDLSLRAPLTAFAVSDAVLQVALATQVKILRRPVPFFDLVADPAAGSLDLVGEFDLASGDRFREGCAPILAGDAVEVVVHLEHLCFIDASGIGLLIGFKNALAARDATLRIQQGDARIARVFAVCGLDSMLTCGAAQNRTN